VKICCIGANGFIGRHLCRALQGIEGARVVALARRFDASYFKAACPAVELRSVDFRDTEAVLALVGSAEVVVDLVASETPRSFPSIGSQRLLEAIAPHLALYEGLAARSTRVVFLSSGGTVYGDVDAPSVSEEAPARPTNGYSFGKYVTEEALRAWSRVSPLTYTILRLSNPFGPGQVVKHEQGLIPAILSAASEGREFQVYGNGGAVRDYIFIADAVKAIARAIALPEASRNEVLNIGSGEGASVLDVIALCEEFLERKLALRFNPADGPMISRSVLDISKAQRLLGWRLEVSLREGLEATVKAFRFQQEGAAA
jgi:UDP-glucose 4-epimerase